MMLDPHRFAHPGTHQERPGGEPVKPCQAAKHWLSPKPGCHGPPRGAVKMLGRLGRLGFLNAGNHGLFTQNIEVVVVVVAVVVVVVVVVVAVVVVVVVG